MLCVQFLPGHRPHCAVFAQAQAAQLLAVPLLGRLLDTREVVSRPTSERRCIRLRHAIMAEAETRSDIRLAQISENGGQSHAEDPLSATEQVQRLLTFLAQDQETATSNNAWSTSADPSPTRMILVSSIEPRGECQYEALPSRPSVGTLP